MKKIILLVCIASATLFMACTPEEYDMFATLYGTITDHDTGDTLSNASVVISPGGKTQTTGNDGRYEFKDLEVQQYTITVQKSGYKTNRKTVTAVVGEKTEINIALTKN